MVDQTDIVTVINRSALIENILNQVIEDFCEPRKEPFQFFWNVILDSSIMSMGAKVKVAAAIAQAIEFKLKLNSLHKVLALRNAFAHHNTTGHQLIKYGGPGEEDKLYRLLHVLNRSGKLERIERRTALADFDKHFEIARDSLVDLKAVIVAAQSNRSPP